MPDTFIGNPLIAQQQILRGFGGLAKTIGSQPTEADILMDVAKARLLKAQAAKAERENALGQSEITGRSDLGALFEGIPAQRQATLTPVDDPGVAGPARALAASRAEQTREVARQDLEALPAKLAAASIRADMDPNRIANAFLFQSANNPSTSSDEVRRALVGTGRQPTPNFALSQEDADAVSLRDANEDLGVKLQVQAAKPPSIGQVRGADLLRLPEGSPARAAAAFGVDKTVDQNSLSGITLTPRPNAAGLPAPAPAARNRGDVVPTSVRADAFKTVSNSKSAIRVINALENAATPEVFGLVGKTRRLIQGVAGQAKAFFSAIDRDRRDAMTEALKLRDDQIDPNDPFKASKWFDPNLSAFDLLSHTLAFKYARILDENGRLSNEDVRNARAALNLESSFAHIDDFKVRMKHVRELFLSAQKDAEARIGGNAGGGSSAAQRPVRRRYDPDTDTFTEVP